MTAKVRITNLGPKRIFVIPTKLLEGATPGSMVDGIVGIGKTLEITIKKGETHSIVRLEN
jgi:hypothetical protein